MNETVAIVDYGMGNIHSVQKALESMGAATLVTADPAAVAGRSKLVLPGVGAFGDAMDALDASGMIPAIREHVRRGGVFLGICLGMHMLFGSSEESPGVRGLGLFPGTVRRFPAHPGLKVPQMGWNGITPSGGCPLLAGVPADANVYFCHSYYPEPEDPAMVAATTDYGGAFASVVWRGNVFGAQFHPEKSQSVGLRILRNFIDL